MLPTAVVRMGKRRVESKAASAGREGICMLQSVRESSERKVGGIVKMELEKVLIKDYKRKYGGGVKESVEWLRWLKRTTFVLFC